MPRITEQRRQARREQILEAARACLLEHGLEAVSMEMIITRSGLSTGAVYGYFKGKEEIISAVVTDGTAEIGRRLAPVLNNPEPPPLPEFTGQVLSAIASFGPDSAGVDRLLVGIHGWSYAQTDPALRAATRTVYRGLRTLFAETAHRWQSAGTLDSDADAGALAELLTSMCLGFVAQRALAGDADIQAHVAALRTLTGPPEDPAARGLGKARTGSPPAEVTA